MEKESWSSKEFLAYLLLYAASTDQEIKPEEREYLLSRVSVDEYSHVTREFNKANDYKRLQTILSFQDRYFPDKESRDNLIKTVREMFLADNEFSSVEEGVLRLLQKVMK